MQKSGLVGLEAALAVARCHSFRRAANELGISTTALSNAVAGLEARLGCCGAPKIDQLKKEVRAEN